MTDPTTTDQHQIACSSCGRRANDDREGTDAAGFVGMHSTTQSGLYRVTQHPDGQLALIALTPPAEMTSSLTITCPSCGHYWSASQPVVIVDPANPGTEPPDDDVATCRICGCTEDTPCPGGCVFVPTQDLGAGDLCSRCNPSAGTDLAGVLSLLAEARTTCVLEANDSIGPLSDHQRRILQAESTLLAAVADVITGDQPLNDLVARYAPSWRWNEFGDHNPDASTNAPQAPTRGTG